MEGDNINSQPHTKAYAYLFKFLIIGDSGVGKTSILARFCDDHFNQTFISTIGIDFKIRTVMVDDVAIKLQIWDTAGQERFKSITTAYYRGAMGIFLVYDVTNSKSFDNIKSWIKNIRDNNTEAIALTMIGNKADLVNKRTIPYITAKKFADENGLDFYETSAKNSDNVNEAFINMARKIKDQKSFTIESGNNRSKKKLVVADDNKKTNKNKCC